jgi:hypothetical protein
MTRNDPERPKTREEENDWRRHRPLRPKREGFRTRLSAFEVDVGERGKDEILTHLMLTFNLSQQRNRLKRHRLELLDE